MLHYVISESRKLLLTHDISDDFSVESIIMADQKSDFLAFSILSIVVPRRTSVDRGAQWLPPIRTTTVKTKKSQRHHHNRIASFFSIFQKPQTYLMHRGDTNNPTFLLAKDDTTNTQTCKQSFFLGLKTL